MDFAFTDEQVALRAVARDYLAARPPTDQPGPASWQAVTALGWTDPDLDTVAAGVLAEECGYALYRGPWLTAVALAAPILRAVGRLLSRPTTLVWSNGCRAVQIAGAWRISGRASGVPDGATATDAIVLAETPAGPALFLVVLDHASRSRVEAAWDSTRDACDFDFADTPAERLDCDVTDALASARLTALTLYACEAVGVARRALDCAVEHARTRTQFGKPIAVNQAVAHPLAEVYASIELGRSLAYRAAWCVAVGEPGSVTDVLAASCAMRETAVSACEAVIQTLGAVGFTWEHPAHRWYRRALWHRGFGGHPASLRAELAESLLPVTGNGDVVGSR